jgi:hypothetical protein
LIFEGKIPKIRDSELSSPLACDARSKASLLDKPFRSRDQRSTGTGQRRKLVIERHLSNRGKKSMAKRRGNPNWGKPEPIGPVVPTVTSFEQIVKEFKLTPDQYIRSTRLREWARRNRNSKYIPEALLEAWGFEIESTL